MKVIVVAEDFTTSRKIIVNTLSKEGYIVIDCVDGKDALNQFNGQHIDLLITDFNMPNMNAPELICFIRNMDEYRYIPIILLTTETREDKLNKANECGITCIMKKPFKNDDFFRVINKALK